MYESYLDLRIVKTKQSIHTAFVSLLHEKSYDKISIQDITKRANINRGTFYLHFQDKDDYTRQYLLTLKKKFNTYFSKVTLENRPAFLLEIFRFFTQEDEFLTLLLTQNNSMETKWMIQSLIKENIQRHILSDVPVQSEIERKYLLTYINSVSFGILIEWIANGKKESPEEMATLMDHLAPFPFL